MYGAHWDTVRSSSHETNGKYYRNIVWNAYPEHRPPFLPTIRYEQWSKQRYETLVSMVPTVVDMLDSSSPLPTGSTLFPVAEVDDASSWMRETTRTERTATRIEMVKTYALAVPLVMLLSLIIAVQWAELFTVLSVLLVVASVLSIVPLNLAASRRGRLTAMETSPAYSSAQWSAQDKAAARHVLKSGGVVPLVARRGHDNTVVVKALVGKDADFSHFVYRID
jgi:hypothetical protein